MTNENNLTEQEADFTINLALKKIAMMKSNGVKRELVQPWEQIVEQMQELKRNMLVEKQAQLTESEPTGVE